MECKSEGSNLSSRIAGFYNIHLALDVPLRFVNARNYYGSKRRLTFTTNLRLMYGLHFIPASIRTLPTKLSYAYWSQRLTRLRLL